MLDPKLARVLMLEATEENQRRAATALRRGQRTRTEALSIEAGAERRQE
ncbi:hypothetical protein QMO56_25795 [Roseomonas sp. E05]|nr:hypothetical protein [Roseomonas sp. E05]MDJ0391521.1 hypothetical protein [Roseomonas sp. E05]